MYKRVRLFSIIYLVILFVTPVDITIPVTVRNNVPSATPDSTQKGKEIFDKMIQALGGKEAISNVQNRVYSAKINAITSQGEQELDAVFTIVYPDKINIEINFQGRTMKQVFNGWQGQLTFMEQTQDLPSSRVQSIQDGFLRDPVWLVNNADSLQFQFLEETTIDTIPVAKVGISISDGRTVTVAVDTRTSLPNRFLYETNTQSGSAVEESIISGFRVIEGVNFPFKQVIISNGQKRQETTISEMKLNQTIDPAIFIIK